MFGLTQDCGQWVTSTWWYTISTSSVDRVEVEWFSRLFSSVGIRPDILCVMFYRPTDVISPDNHVKFGKM